MRGESHVAFQAFRTYAELGPGRRLVDVARQLSKSVVLMQRWSGRWSWQARVAAYDSAQWQRDAEKKQEERDKALKRRLVLGRHMQQNSQRPIFLIVDGHPAHPAAAVKRFLASSQGRLRLFYLPSYSPELNPDESVWRHLKTHNLGRARITGPDDLRRQALIVCQSLFPGADRALCTGMITSGYFRTDW